MLLLKNDVQLIFFFFKGQKPTKKEGNLPSLFKKKNHT